MKDKYIDHIAKNRLYRIIKARLFVNLYGSFGGSFGRNAAPGAAGGPGGPCWRSAVPAGSPRGGLICSGPRYFYTLKR